MGAGAKIIGNKSIGDRVSIGVDAVVHKTKIEDDSVVIHAQNGEIQIIRRKKKQCMAQSYFDIIF